MHLLQQSSVQAIKTSFQPETQYTKQSHLLPRNESGTRLLNLHLIFPNWIKGSLFQRRVAKASQRRHSASSWAALCSQICECSMNVNALCVGGYLMLGKGRKPISFPLAYCSQETICKDVGCSHPAFHFECVLSPSKEKRTTQHHYFQTSEPTQFSVVHWLQRMGGWQIKSKSQDCCSCNIRNLVPSFLYKNRA